MQTRDCLLFFPLGKRTALCTKMGHLAGSTRMSLPWPYVSCSSCPTLDRLSVSESSPAGPTACRAEAFGGVVWRWSTRCALHVTPVRGIEPRPRR